MAGQWLSTIPEDETLLFNVIFMRKFFTTVLVKVLFLKIFFNFLLKMPLQYLTVLFLYYQAYLHSFFSSLLQLS